MQRMYETKGPRPYRVKVRGNWRTFHGITSEAHLIEQLTKRYGPGTLAGDQWLATIDQPWETVTLSQFMPEPVDLEDDVDNGA